jgi:tRNA-Thr(GGU) m(6)t(6)A37 methyltransferase TsaA
MAGSKMDIAMKSIGTVHTPFGTTGEIPKGLDAKHDADGVIEIAQAFEPGLQDIEGFSHLYILWHFHRVDRYDLVAYPPSDDRPHGVFATRSPLRPSPIGLTVVELLRREGRQLHVRGVDMLDGTPVLDIKPYLSSIPPAEIRRGWLAAAEERRRTTSG